MSSSDEAVPVAVSAVFAGLAAALVGPLPWVLFATLNQRLLVQVPWAIAPTAAWLWLYWSYLGGAGWPQSTSELRRTSLRANGLSPDVWAGSMLAGLLGLATLLPLLGIMSRLQAMPAETQSIQPPALMPFTTIILLLVMASVVAGVVEEASFRGYMQGPIERRHGLLVAVLVNGALFGLAHFAQHPAAVLFMLPYYIAVSAVYGGLAYATNSILPPLVLHAGGDVLSLTRLWATGRPEWQLTETAPRLIWDTGLDTAFVATVAVFFVLSAATWWSYGQIARTARATS